jgi:TonB family protein
MTGMLRWTAVGTLLASVSLDAGAQQTTAMRQGESTIRRLATATPKPSYPAASAAKRVTGVAVAAIVSAPDGRVTEVEMLEAPDELIGRAVQDALRLWRIEPMTVVGRPEKYGVRGKVTFYFRIVNGRAEVFHPEEIPGGPKPEPSGGPPSAPPGARSSGPPGATSTPLPTTVQHDQPANLEIGETELNTLVASSSPTILDIRERDAFRRQHRDGAVNIPRDELAIRAYVELDRKRPVVIDCTNAETRDCHAAARSLLRGVGIAKVLIFLP